jgi:exopolyphosphatase/pppGpp-phosphohydrolase
MDFPEMEVRRVDMILGGALLAHECLEILGADKIKISGFSLRDGILKREIDLYKNNLKTHEPYHQKDLIAKAVLFGGNEEHVSKNIILAETIFDKTKSLHKLHKNWKPFC